MNSKHYLVIGIVGLSCFVLGFLFANSLNRTEIGRLSATAQQKVDSDPSKGNLVLTTEEIEAKIAESDANPNNFNFQKGLGIALYRYGAMKQDTSLIKKSIIPLGRATKIDPADNDVLVALGNAFFDIGYYEKTNEPFETSRGYYLKALEARPKDIELRTDIALTYFLQTPPDLERAAGEFEKALELDPKHEKSLQFYAQTLAKQGSILKANEMMDRLRSVNPQNPLIPEISAMLNSGENAK